MDPALLLRLITAAVLGLLAAIVSRTFRFLTPGGSIAAAILAAVLFGLGGVQWLLPILLFFFSSSILSRVRDRLHRSTAAASEKGSERDALQVVANGGIGAVLVIFWQRHPGLGLYAAYLGSLAAATADTWGTEIGMLSGQRPMLLTNLRRVEPGASGGVTAAGCVGGAAGALLLAASGAFWIEGEILRVMLIVTAAGISGAVLDTVLGAALQVQYRCTLCDALTERAEHCGAPVRYDHGARWLINDRVNLVCNLAGAVLAFLLLAGPM